MLGKLREFDFYRKIPKDLTETTFHGTLLSICASIFMLVLFIAELWSFLSFQVVTNVVIDPSTDSLLRINFNITLPNIPCEFATIDVIDVLGTRKDNVTLNINKWKMDENGIRKNYEGRNVEQRDILHETHHDLALLHSNGIHAVPLEESNFDEWIGHFHYVFVNFYAPWCIWCQRLEPVWEAFAERCDELQVPVSVVSVDCVAYKNLCNRFKIQAFPSLKFFKVGVEDPPEYKSDRTVDAFIEFANSKVAMDEQLARMDPATRDMHTERIREEGQDHPGCQLAGFLLVNRVPGNFHIESRSKYHNINSAGANLSHIVNHFSIGPVINRSIVRRIEREVPDNLFSFESTQPMNDNVYMISKLHQVYHHYIKIVSTHLELGSRYQGENAILAYQMIQSSQIMQYNEEEVPEARFAYDLSPMSVIISQKGKHWYEFVTSICALIGGTFTVVGILSSFLGIIFKTKKI